MKKHRLIFILLISLLALSACAPAPQVRVLPIETVFAATYAAIMAQTAAAEPMETLVPTSVSTLRPTSTSFPTATIVVLVPTNTVLPTIAPVSTPTNITSGSGNVLYACNILSVFPQGDYVVKPGERFNWTWQVENIGTTRWRGDSMSVVYIRGSHYALKKEYPLGDHINIGDNDILTIKMQAPKEPGTYITTWSLKKGIHNFCYAQLKIIVRK